LAQQFLVQLIAAPREPQQLLAAFRAYRRDEPPAGRELLEQHVRNRERGRGHQDAVVRAVRGPTLKAVAMTQMNVADPEFLETRACALQQRTDALDAVDESHQRREHRGLIAA